MGRSIDYCAPLVPAARAVSGKAHRQASPNAVAAQPIFRTRGAGPDGIDTPLAIPCLGEFVRGRRCRIALSRQQLRLQGMRKLLARQKGAAPVSFAGYERRSLMPRFPLRLGVVRQGLKTKPGPIITLSGILGRSSNSSGFFFITFRMCLGSMCLLTSKVALSTPRRSKVSCALQRAR
jgi:hypothetical protein